MEGRKGSISRAREGEMKEVSRGWLGRSRVAGGVRGAGDVSREFWGRL